MAADNPLLLSATIGNIEIEGDRGHGMRSHYRVRVYVDNNQVFTSGMSKADPASSKWICSIGKEIWFEPSSIMKIVVDRGFKINLFNHLVGQHEGKIVDLLRNETSMDLKDNKGAHVAVKMKIDLSPNANTDDYIKKFMVGVEADVARLGAIDGALSVASTLGQVLTLTKAVMDKVTKVYPILNASWTVVSSVYQAVQETKVQDDSIRELAETLREMVGTANEVPDLLVIPNTTNVIEEIGRQSLQVASLIHEYTRLSFVARTARIQLPADLKSRIAGCRANCASLKDKFYARIQLDANARAKDIQATLQQTERKVDIIMDSQLADKIHKWLSPPDFSSNRNEATAKRQKGTCSWFLESERFLKWHAEPGLFWVHGKAGSGKSILCSAILDHLSEQNPPQKMAYFFFDGRDSQTKRQVHHNLIRSLISQFCHHRGGIPVELAALYKKFGAYQQPSVDQFQMVLRDVLNGFSDAYIVVDALDECTDRSKTVEWINGLVMDPTTSNVHIIVTSRPEPDIKEVLGSLDRLSMNVMEGYGNKDIEKYLELEMASKSKFTKFGEKMQMKMKLKLMGGAAGSFRWVALQLAELEKCASADEIHQQLVGLPRGLTEVYARILKNIDEKHRADVKTFLQWLVFSKCQMKVEEIAETITVDFGSNDGPIFNSTKRYIDPKDVLVRCSGLATESSGYIKLSHFSVKEFLLSDHVDTYFHINTIDAHLKIAEISAAYLLQFDFLTEDILQASPLAQYVADNWVHHARLGAMETSNPKLMLQIFGSDSAALRNWSQILYYGMVPLGRQDHPKDKAEGLYSAVLLGFSQLAKHLMKCQTDMNAEMGVFGHALQAACRTENEVMVKLLLKHGADVNAQGGTYGTPLLAACWVENKVLIKLLLEHGADVNAQVGGHANPLQMVSHTANEGIVQLLLEYGADVNAHGGSYHNALHAASMGGNKAIVKVLLEHGADVNAQGGYFGNALQAASEDGKKAIIKLLLKHGADVNAQGGYFGNALQAASYAGNEVIVKLLLRHNADINTQGGEFGNALQAASYKGNEGTVKLLLEHGADINAQGGKYGNALKAASIVKHVRNEAVVKLLLEHGADINAQGGCCHNTLKSQ